MAGKEGWFRTRADAQDDGVFWLQGFQMGRVHPHWDLRWSWSSWCGHCEQGVEPTREAAMAHVESRADLSTMTIGCIVADDHQTRNRLFAEAQRRFGGSGSC